MASPAPSANPILGSAPVACAACRRLKMRCVGAEKPPCKRCLKNSRRCVVNPSRRGLTPANSLRKRPPPVASSVGELQDVHTTTSSQGSISTISPSRTPPEVLPKLPNPRGPTHSSGAHDSPSISRVGNISCPTLPPVWSFSPLDILASVAAQDSLSGSQHRHLREPEDHRIDIPENILVEHIEFFREKILYYVPVIDDADLSDERHVIAYKRPLAYCASYVASQFISGSTNVRQKLLAHVSEFLETIRGPLTQDGDKLWTQLQALAILYAYCPPGEIFPLSGASQPVTALLDYYTLKSSVEAFAFRAGLHRSIDRLRIVVRGGASSDISKSSAFSIYVYWLWLVTMSHHFSVMTRTPPTLQEDSTTAVAFSFLRDIPRPPRVTRVLAEVDLQTLWRQAGRSAPGLSEWWCTPSDSISVEGIVAVLEDLEGALEVWGIRWGLRGESNVTISNVDISKNGAVNFHFQATRFFISAFATRYILEKDRFAAVVEESTSSRGKILSPLGRESVVKSFQAAHAFSRCLVDISPLRRENVRYMGEFGYALIAFCCLYLVQLYEFFGTALQLPESYMTSVEEVAAFMREMAIANNITPRLYGNLVSQQVKQVLEGLSEHVDRDKTREFSASD